VVTPVSGHHLEGKGGRREGEGRRGKEREGEGRRGNERKGDGRRGKEREGEQRRGERVGRGKNIGAGDTLCLPV
jgi:hypothetical protein